MIKLVKTMMSLRGVSQSELAKRTGVSTASLSKFLNGTSDFRSDSLVKVLSALGMDLDNVLMKEINRSLGHDEEVSIGEDIRYLIDTADSITSKTIADTLIASFKTAKSTEIKSRLVRIKRYRDSIKTIRRPSC